LWAVEGVVVEFLGGSYGEGEPPGLGVYVASEGPLCMGMRGHGTMKAPANAANLSGTRLTRGWVGIRAATRKSKVARMSRASRNGEAGMVVRVPAGELAPSCRTRQLQCRLRSG
jgi:hypothetical protein